MEVQSAVSPLGLPLPIPEPPSLSNFLDRELSPSFGPEDLLRNQPKDQLREKEQARKRQEELLRQTAKKEEDENLLRENRFRNLSAQVLPKIALEIRQREQQGDPMENIEQAKEMVSFLLDGGVSTALEGALTGGAEEDSANKNDKPAANPNQGIQDAQDSGFTVPRR